MLNYIWFGLIAVALLVAVGNDVADEVQNTYRNGVPIVVGFTPTVPPEAGVQKREGVMTVSAEVFNEFYGIKSQSGEVRQPVVVTIDPALGSRAEFACDDATPARWQAMGRSASSKDRLTARVVAVEPIAGSAASKLTLILEPVHLVKMKAVTQAAIDFANTAVTIALGLIGVMALWLGLIKVAEEAGLVRLLTRLLTPVTRRLFPDIPADHPAIGNIIMNTAANMLGLSNAATPIGLKAMEELNKLNPKPGTATNAMVTFLAINTGGLILIPATAIAVRAASGSVNPGLIIGTSIFGAACATIAGITASKLFQRLPRYKKEMEPDAPEPTEVRHD
jgi:spore maturation protein A